MDKKKTIQILTIIMKISRLMTNKVFKNLKKNLKMIKSNFQKIQIKIDLMMQKTIILNKKLINPLSPIILMVDNLYKNNLLSNKIIRKIEVHNWINNKAVSKI